MKTTNCILCGAQSNLVLENKVMGKYSAQYYQCSNCALLFALNPTWLNEAYNSAIAKTDTGIVVRNINNVVLINDILKKWYLADSTVLDYGGGTGLFVRMLRDVGYDAVWYDKYSDPILCRGFEWDGSDVDVLLNFEVFEHYDNPLESISELFKISSDLIVSTELYSDGSTLKEKDWWYYQFETGQHISFYSKETMEFIAKKFNVNYYYIYGLHWFTKKKINPISIKLFNYVHRFSITKKKWVKNLNYSNCLVDMEMLSSSLTQNNYN